MTSISLVSRTGLLVASCVALPTLLACLDHPLKPVQYEAVQEGREGIALTVNKDVDIIFMIDDSGSMAEEQLALAENFGEFIRVLEQPGVEANYRIGITTSDKGNPLCPTTTKQPDDGKFKLSTCRSRQSHFTFNTVPPVEAFQVACADICPYETIEILPTTTDQDQNASARPWVESIEGVTNIGCAYRPGSNDCEEITTEEAFQCLGPMGIAGCGYEEQLEGVYRAVLRAQNDNEDQYGFIRPNAILAVVLVSDEADGSLNRSVGNIYDINGSKVFWQDPDANFPTSAVSWKAGVECVPIDGDGLPYDDCYAQHYDFDRNVVPEERAAEEAVLYPVSRYINQIQAIEDQKKQINPNQEVLVAGILGVTSDYRYGDEITYRNDPTDPQFVYDFGIGAGCISQLVVEGLEAFQPKAVPPVRQRDFVEHFVVGGDTNIFSVCDQDYARALEAIARMIEDQIRPACMPACVADMDPTTTDLEPSCVLEQESPSTTGGGVERTIIPECEDQDGTMPEDADACYVMRTGDDMDPACIEDGWNLEFQLFRAVPAPGGTSVSATCELSAQPRVDCPDLP
jgi:hypothetical protein